MCFKKNSLIHPLNKILHRESTSAIMNEKLKMCQIFQFTVKPA